MVRFSVFPIIPLFCQQILVYLVGFLFVIYTKNMINTVQGKLSVFPIIPLFCQQILAYLVGFR
jgi:hypothetical protein